MDDVKTVLEREFNLEKLNTKSSVDEFTLMLMDEEDSKGSSDIMNDMRLSSLMKKYLEIFGLNVNDDYRDVVPIDFELATDSDYKCRILEEAISKRVRIEETSLYPNLVEHVDFLDEGSNYMK